MVSTKRPVLANESVYWKMTFKLASSISNRGVVVLWLRRLTMFEFWP